MDATSFGSVQSARFSKCLVFIGELKTAYTVVMENFPGWGCFVPYNMKLLFGSTGGGVFYYCTFVAAMERPWQQHALLDLPLFYYTNADNL